MKRTAFLLLILCTCLMLFSCDRKDKRDIFFEPETLAEYTLADIPVPNIKNSRLRSDTLYLNLTDEEYEKYVSEVSDYLLARDDFYNLCYREGDRLDADTIRSELCTPLYDTYTVEGAASTGFVFSTVDELGYHGQITDPVRIDFLRGEGVLALTSFRYNTIMTFSFNSTIVAHYNLCAFDHDFAPTKNYIMPGTEEQLILRICNRCDLEEHLNDPASDGEIYNVVISEGRDFLAESIIKRHKSGTLVDIRVKKSDAGGYMLTANNVLIPICTEEDGVVSYRFVMPSSHVNIRIMQFDTWPPIEEEPPKTYTFTQLDVWMFEAEPESVVSATVTSSPIAAAPGAYVENTHIIDGASAAELLSRYKSLVFTKTDGDMPDGGAMHTVTFRLNDGTSYSVTLSNLRVSDYLGAVYAAEELPAIPDGALSLTTFSYQTEETVCEVYTYGETPELVGELELLSSLEFVSISAEDAPIGDPTHVIKADFGDIFVVSDKVFYTVDEDDVKVYHRLADGSFTELIS